MNYNVIGYIVFLIAIYFITIHVGWKFYKHGAIYLAMMLPNDHHLVESINKILLIAYYLFNIGYTTISISTWNTISTLNELIHLVTFQIGKVMLILAIAHFVNMTWILIYSLYNERKSKKINV